MIPGNYIFNPKRFLINFAVLVAALFLSLLFAEYGIKYFATSDSNTIDWLVWKNEYRNWLLSAVSVGFLSSIAWYLYCTVQKDAHWNKMNKRVIWAFLFIASFALGGGLAIIPAIKLKDGMIIIIIATAFFSSLTYYFSTLIASPKSFAFTAIGSRQLSRLFSSKFPSNGNTQR